MKLNRDEPWVIDDFNNFHKRIALTRCGKLQTVCFELLPKYVIELIAVAMPFGYLLGTRRTRG